jgi:pilus assembly protein Flp/PilA
MYTVLLCPGSGCKRLFTVDGTSYTGEIFKLLIHKGAFFDGDWHAICNNRYIPAEAGQIDKRREKMNNMLLKLYVKFQDLASREEGQDLVEYALVVALIAFGATAGMKNLAGAINTAFSNVSSQLGSAIS